MCSSEKYFEQESQANFKISITGGDGPQDDFERAESFRSLLCGIFVDSDALKHCVLSNSLRN